MTQPALELPLNLFKDRDTYGIFRQATKDFFISGGPFILAILPAILMIYAGAYVGLLSALSVADMENVPIKLLGALAAIGVMAYGFWRFIVYMTSLNRSYAHLLQNQNRVAKPGTDARQHFTPDFAGDYKKILTDEKKPLLSYINGIVLVQIIAAVVFSVVCSPLAIFFPPIVPNVLIQLLTLLVYTWVSMGFQVIALGDLHGVKPAPGLLGVLKQSKAIVGRNYGRCFSLLLLSFVITYYLIPGVFVSVAELSGGISRFNHIHQPLVQAYLNYLPKLPIAFPTAIDISHQISQQLLSNFINSLLLPWGTFVYALLYGSLIYKEAPAIINE